MEKDIVLFLGAGFSCDAGLPIIKNFGSESRKDYDGLEKHLNPQQNYRYAARPLREAAETFYWFQDFCRRSYIIRGSDLDNMEEVFCVAETILMSSKKGDKICCCGRTETPQEVVNQIKKWLWKIYQQYPIHKQEKENKETCYDKLFKKIIKDYGLDSKLTIITTNYDLVFEYNCSKNGFECYYPIDAESINIGKGTPYVYFGSNSKKVPVCKLHGSINFFQNKSSGDVIYIADRKAGCSQIGKSKINKELPAVFALEAIWYIKRKYPELSPAIIPPTYAKLEQYKWVKDMWNAAFDAVVNAKKIIFIGYSMPPSDGFMKSFLQEHLPQEKHPRNLKYSLLTKARKLSEDIEMFLMCFYAILIQRHCKKV
ncbi:MAG: SIR2 family protein [Candidatus Brocadiales bacterium]